MADGFYFAVPAVDIFLPESIEDSLAPDEARAALVLRDQQIEDYLNGLANLSVYALSNTTGVTSSSALDPQAISIAGLGNASVGFSAGALVISAAAAGAGNQSAGVIGFGNTAGTTGRVTGPNIDMIYVGGNNITLSQSTNGASGTVTIVGPSVPAQTADSMGWYASSQTTGAASSTTIDVRSVTLVGRGGLSVGYSGGSVILSGATGGGGAGSVTAGMSNLGNTSGTSGVVSGSNVALFLAGGNNVTLSQSINGSTATVTISAANQTVQTQNLHNVTISGNTSGALAAISSGTMTLAGGNNVTLSQAGNAVTISAANAPAQSAQTLGVYGSSQTTGAASSTTVDARSLTIVGQGGLSVGASNGSIVLSGATGGAGGGFSAGVSNLGLTAGSTGVTGTRLVLVGSDGLMLSQSTDANGATITFDPPTLSRLEANTAALLSSSTSNMTLTSMTLVRLTAPTAVAFSQADFAVSVNLATSAIARTAALNISAVYGLYSRSGSTLTPIVAGSSTTTYTWASNSAAYSSLTGPRMLSFPLQSTITPGEYYLGVQLSTASTSSIGTATTALSATIAPIYATHLTSRHFDYMSLDPSVSRGPIFGLQGVHSVQVTATSQTIQQSNIRMSGTALVRAGCIAILRNEAYA